MTERANMPSISTAARKEFDKYPDSLKTFNGQAKEQQTVLVTCQSCDKPYNKTEADTLLADFPELNQISYANTCLKCIKESSDKMKESYKESLAIAKHELDELAIAYQTAHNSHKALANKYKAYDYQSSRINHHLTKPVKVAKASTSKTGTKRTPKTDEQKKATMIKKMLGNLTEEQLKNIMKTI